MYLRFFFRSNEQRNSEGWPSILFYIFILLSLGYQLDCPPFIIIIIIYSLTARVVGAPQMISQPVSSILFPVLYCPLELGELQACSFPDVVFPPLPLSALSSSPFHCALLDGFGQT